MCGSSCRQECLIWMRGLCCPATFRIAWLPRGGIETIFHSANVFCQAWIRMPCWSKLALPLSGGLAFYGACCWVLSCLQSGSLTWQCLFVLTQSVSLPARRLNEKCLKPSFELVLRTLHLLKEVLFVDLVIHFAITVILLGWKGIHSERKVCVCTWVSQLGKNVLIWRFPRASKLPVSGFPCLNPRLKTGEAAGCFFTKKSFLNSPRAKFCPRIKNSNSAAV